MLSFNLINEKWLPCIMAGGRSETFSLRNIFSKAPDILEISDQSPLVTVALHRLLLAIIHRSFERGYGPVDTGEWKALWDEGQFELPEQYLNRWFKRFDLFDASYPFYQCASLAKSTIKNEPVPIGNLLHESAVYLSKPILFDHNTEASFRVLSPAEAVRFLIAFQSFVVGGFSGLSKPRIKGEESAKAGPLVKSAICLMKGKNLFETLMLNLHVFNIEDGEPFKAEKDDKPSWENDKEVKPGDCMPEGYFNLLTWQSRRILLIPEKDKDGRTVIHDALIRKGNEFPKDFSLYGKEPMLAFRKVKKPVKGTDPWPPIAFREDRVLWRDSLALFQSIEEERARPKILGWLNDLVGHGILSLSSVYDMAIIGFISDQASISLWRHERLPLPVKYLNDEILITKLKEALVLAEDGSKTLNFAAGNLARMVIAPEKKPNERLSESQKKDADNFVNSLAPTRPYWASLGISFNRLVTELAQDKSPDGEYGATVLPLWAEEVRKSARQAFREAINSLDHDGRILKAVTIAENNFDIRLNTLIKEFLAPYQKSENTEVRHD